MAQRSFFHFNPLFLLLLLGLPLLLWAVYQQTSVRPKAGSTITYSDGTLDQTFGSNGTVSIDVGGGSDKARDIAVQPDGKIVVVGDAEGGAGREFGLVRLNQDGILDSTFGTSGKVLSDFRTRDNAPNAVGIQADGKIVVAGYGFAVVNTPADFLIGRYLSNGTLDSTFGIGGFVVTDFDGTRDEVEDLVIQPDGKILVGGNSANDKEETSMLALARYLPDGQLDPSFGFNNSGRRNEIVGRNGGILQIFLQPDGNILAVGYTTDGSKTSALVIRYTASGIPDSGFGSNGKIVIGLSRNSSDYGRDIVVRPDGKIVVLVSPSFGPVTLFRYDASGKLDSTFGTGGKVSTALLGQYGIGFSLVLQPDGMIVVGGKSEKEFELAQLALLRFQENGQIDSSFGQGGVVVTDMNPKSDVSDYISALWLQPDGKLLATGVSGSDFGIARYGARQTLPTPTSIYQPTPTIRPASTPIPTPRFTPAPCTPRPSCLDARPRPCRPPEPPGGWCPRAGETGPNPTRSPKSL